jgi:tetratricopeptide (TPR) repeat protein
MKAFSRIMLAVMFVTVAVAQSPEPPLSDSRLTIHTLVREDIFAGFLSNDLTRLARGERNIETLLEKRPNAKAELLAWKGGATLYRAVVALEDNRRDDFARQYQQALELFAQARESSPNNGGVFAVLGGSYVVFADRLPQEHRAAAWAQAWDAYQILWKQQSAFVDKLPVHIRGELLGGLAQSAQRTGREAEMAQYLDRILESLRDTPYEPVARKWKANPKAAASTSVTCLTCHDPGRLSARLTALNSK